MVEKSSHDGLIRPEEFSTCRTPLRELDQPRAGEAHVWFLDLDSLGFSLRDALGGGGRPASAKAPDTGAAEVRQAFLSQAAAGSLPRNPW